MSTTVRSVADVQSAAVGCNFGVAVMAVAAAAAFVVATCLRFATDTQNR